MNNLTYTNIGGYLIPNLSYPRNAIQPIGKYGRMRRDYLEQHNPLLFEQMLFEGTLWAHIVEIDHTAVCQIEALLRRLALQNGITESMKRHSPLEWAQQMQMLKLQAEEVILPELIYAEEY